MATFIKCPKAVSDLALEILCEFPTHKPLLDAKAQIAYVFAHCGQADDLPATNLHWLQNEHPNPQGMCSNEK